jgi:Tfp pilus assembly protein PilO
MNLKKTGLYLIVVLALLRFLIYPLHASIQEKKVVFGEWSESYRLKLQAQERQRGAQQKTVVEKGAVRPHLFDKGVSNTSIQTEILGWITNAAEKKGLAVLNFEMLDSMAGKNVTELPIVLRLKGRAESFIELLEMIEQNERVLSVRSMEITRSGVDQAFSLTLSAFRVEKG